MKTALLALALFSAGWLEPLRHQAAAQAASGVAILQVDTDRRLGTIDPEDLRPVPRAHQPLGRGRSLRRADPRRRLRGPRLRDLLDSLRTAGRGARRRDAVRAWHEERADHRRRASRRESGKGESSWSPAGAMTGRSGSRSSRARRACRCACWRRMEACWRIFRSGRADRRGRKCRSRSRARAPIATRRSRSPPPDAAPCSSTSSR